VKDRRNGKVFFDVVPPEERGRACTCSTSSGFAGSGTSHPGQSTLVAPYDATVASLNIVSAQYVEQNQVVLTLATLNKFQIETTDLSERDFTKVRIGAPTSIFIEALNESVSGEVVSISPIADTVDGDAVFKVTIEFDEQPRGLLWGMTAEVIVSE
jgi:multidrug efflux pump subunit AcrA (membrane-fusion protein)